MLFVWSYSVESNVDIQSDPDNDQDFSEPIPNIALGPWAPPLQAFEENIWIVGKQLLELTMGHFNEFCIKTEEFPVSQQIFRNCVVLAVSTFELKSLIGSINTCSGSVNIESDSRVKSLVRIVKLLLQVLTLN